MPSPTAWETQYGGEVRAKVDARKTAVHAYHEHLAECPECSDTQLCPKGLELAEDLL